MKKLLTKTTSVFLALVLIISCFSVAPISFGAERNGLDGEIYWRDQRIGTTTNILYFHTDFDEAVKEFKQLILNRESEVVVSFAAKDDPTLAYNPADMEDTSKKCDRLINRLMQGAFEYDPNDPYAGDFLYHSINTAIEIGILHQTYDPTNDRLGDDQYYCYTVGLSNVTYYSDNKYEDFLHNFIGLFNQKYIAPDATEYEKVKTIYDFVVRNADYDFDTYRDRHIDPTSDAFRRAHSAYGAVLGTLLKNDPTLDSKIQSESTDISEMFTELFPTQKSVEGQNVVSKYNNGLAVCEGYSKLFYAMCVANGITCRIVDGDYVAGQASDPHEWNYVYMSDCDEWYSVDTTYASQASIKKLDYNSYDYFLKGSKSPFMNEASHQQPYKIEYIEGSTTEIKLFNTGDNKIEYQLVDWYSDEYNTENEYDYPEFDITYLNNTDETLTKNSVIISREYDYAGQTRTSFILYKKSEDGTSLARNLVFNEDGVEVSESGPQGFVYRSVDDVDFKYTIRIPYVVRNKEESGREKGWINVQNYSYPIDGTRFVIDIPIVPMDMTSVDSYSKIEINNQAAYTGNVITPSATIVDGFNKPLTEGVDYTIKVYLDEACTQPITEIKDIRSYWVRVEYKNNYSGSYKLLFTVDKTDIGNINFPVNSFPYRPKKMRTVGDKVISNIADYFIYGLQDIEMGEFIVKPGQDFSVGYNVRTGGSTGLDYGSTGVIELTGLSTSPCIVANSKKYINYTISGKFDISAFKVVDNATGAIYENGLCEKPASTETYTYTGNEIKPESLNVLNTYLDSDEYRIVSYSNCVNAGMAKVLVEGIGGCTGRAEMYYYITKKQITGDMVSYKLSGNDLLINLTYNGMTLRPNVDYTVAKYSDSVIITATPNGNFAGSYSLKASGIGNLDVKQDASITEPNTNNTNNTNTNNTNSKPAQASTEVTVQLSKTQFTYNGKNQKPTVIVKDANGTVIPASKYTVSYPKNSKAIGAYKVSISGICSVKLSYTIVPKGTTLSSAKAGKGTATVKWKKQTTETTGYEIRYSTSKNMAKAKTVAVKKNKTTSLKLSKLKSKKTYYVQVRTYKKVGKKNYASQWSKAKSVKIK